jgi:hypothetical protein
MCQPKTEIDMRFLRRLFYLGLIIFLVGIIGLIINIVTIMDSQGIVSALSLYQRIWDHRYYTVENGVPYLGWLFQFLALNGMGILIIVVFLRLVEFRGNAAPFAKATTTIRRFGFVAFTVYCTQFVYYICDFIVTSIIGTPYQHLHWEGTFIIIIFALFAFHGILYLWEKVNFVGSIEWMIGTISYSIIPARKAETKEGDIIQKWWQKGSLDVKGTFYSPNWINIIERNEVDHVALKESRLSLKVALIGLLFFPFALTALSLAINSQKTEQKNKFNQKARIIAILGMIFFAIWVPVTSFVSLGMLGISL